MVSVRITSSRSPGTMTSVPGPTRSSMWCGSIAPIAMLSMTRSRSGPVEITRPRTPWRIIPSVGFDRIGRYGSTPSSGIPCRSRPRRRVSVIPGCSSIRTLLTIAPATRTPCAAKCEALRTISSIGRPTPPSDTITAGAPSIWATTAFDSPITAPTPACPVPSMRSTSWPANSRCASRIRSPRSSTTWPAMYALVNPRGMWTGLITEYDSGRSKIERMRTASSSAGWPSSITVRWPTGLMNPVCSPRRRNPSTSPSAVVVLPRFWPVAARYSWRTGAEPRQPREAVLRSTSWTASRSRVRASSSTPSGSR